MFCCYYFKDLSKTSGKNQLEANLSELNSSWLLIHSDRNPRFLSKFSGKKSLKFFDFRVFFRQKRENRKLSHNWQYFQTLSTESSEKHSETSERTPRFFPPKAEQFKGLSFDETFSECFPPASLASFSGEPIECQNQKTWKKVVSSVIRRLNTLDLLTISTNAVYCLNTVLCKASFVEEGFNQLEIRTDISIIPKNHALSELVPNFVQSCFP